MEGPALRVSLFFYKTAMGQLGESGTEIVQGSLSEGADGWNQAVRVLEEGADQKQVEDLMGGSEF